MSAPLEVLYTPEIFSLQAVGGVSRYAAELARGIQARGHRVEIAAGLHVNQYVRGRPEVRGVYFRFAAFRTIRWRQALNRAFCRVALARRPKAIPHMTYYGNMDYLRGRPFVVTIYDMIHELFRDRFAELSGADPVTLRYKRICCERAEQIIAISESTKADVVRLFGLDPAKVTAIPLGNSMEPDGQPVPSASNTERTGRDSETPYLLYVGARAAYKNFIGFLEAFGHSATLPKQFRLVCFGGGPFIDAERRRITELGLETRVTQQSGGDAALRRCYQGATALIYPSLYEGFGLPLLEAMSQGCPVLCAGTSSLPEVAGEAAEYFDPESSDSIQAVLEATLADSARLEALRALGRERGRLFSWERCAAETAEVYRRVIT